MGGERRIMRILMLNYEYPPLGGGASPVTRALCEHLATAGHEVDVVTMGYRRLPRVELSGGVRVIRVPTLRHSPVRAETPEMLSYILAALPPTLALTQRWRYDVVHAHFIVPTGILAAAVRRISGLPLVITAHGSDIPRLQPGSLHARTSPDRSCLARGCAQRRRDRFAIALLAHPDPARLRSAGRSDSLWLRPASTALQRAER